MRHAAWLLLLLALDTASSRPEAGTSPEGRAASGSEGRVKGEPGQESVLRVSWAPPAHLDPHLASTLSESRYVLAMFEGLTTHAADGVTVAPGMAESWEISADGRTWTFRLRKAMWSNGDPLTAHDFVYAWRRALKVGSPFSPLFRAIRGVGPWLDAGESRGDPEQVPLGFEAVDAATFRVTLDRRAPWLADLLSFPCFVPLHEKSIVEHGPSWVKPGRMVTNGPYLPDAATIAALSLRKNPAYWDPVLAAAPGRIVVGLHSDEVALQRFRDGALDWIAGEQIPGEPADRVRFDTWGTFFLSLNVKRPPFETPAVRRAWAQAVDRDRLVEGSAARPRGTLVPPGFPGYPEIRGIAPDATAAMEDLLRAVKFDLSKALAAEILIPDGARFAVVAERLRDRLEKSLGVPVKVRTMKWPAYLKAVDAGEFQAALGGWIGEFFDPASFLEPWGKGGARNGTGWSSDAYDALLASAGEQPDAKKRLEILAKAESLLLSEAAVIPLYGAADSYLATPRVAGLSPNLMGRFPVKHLRVKP